MNIKSFEWRVSMRCTVKVFWLLSTSTVLILLYSLIKVKQIAFVNNKILSRQEIIFKKDVVDKTTFRTNLKFILLWTDTTTVPFVYFGEGQSVFINRSCPYVNCYVTGNREFLENYTNFDAVIFSGPEIIRYEKYELPEYRSASQKYVFASIESDDYYPVCNKWISDGFFNWTWTYRLNSDVRWGYIVVRNEENEIIGPNKVMHWIKAENMKPVSEELKNVLRNKKYAAAWFVSNCRTKSLRYDYVVELKQELAKYNLEVDIYGDCGNYHCSRDRSDECDTLIEKYYFFYLAFENSFGEDYVTEKLLHALQYSAVPIVYGGANYASFMPDGIYLNAIHLNPRKLAAKMHQLITNPEEYQSMFKWRNHYTYWRTTQSAETDEYCRFCEILNNEKLVKTNTVYDDLKKWWTKPTDRCQVMDYVRGHYY